MKWELIPEPYQRWSRSLLAKVVQRFSMIFVFNNQEKYNNNDNDNKAVSPNYLGS